MGNSVVFWGFKDVVKEIMYFFFLGFDFIEIKKYVCCLILCGLVFWGLIYLFLDYLFMMFLFINFEIL